MRPKIRLHVDAPLGPGQQVALGPDAARYLFSVMRLRPGDAVAVFNGRDGEWRAEVLEAGRRGGSLVAVEQTVPQQVPPDLWLLFAPLRKARTDFVVEKAAEMGAARILPVQTEFTNAERVRRDRLQAHAIEAAEQCGNTHVAEVGELRSLDEVLDNWPPERRIMLCDEALAGATCPSGLPAAAGGGPIAPATEPGIGGSPGGNAGDDIGGSPGGGGTGSDSRAGSARGGSGPWAILIGPEGGFSERERSRLQRLPFVHRVRLGPRILRADTAAVAAMTVWQMALGDWT